jgi:hypothetical protein
MLGNGKIWYHQNYWTGNLKLLMINGANDIEDVQSFIKKSWKFNDSLITHSCFKTNWMSSDNYEEFFELVDRDDVYFWSFYENVE